MCEDTTKDNITIQDLKEEIKKDKIDEKIFKKFYEQIQQIERDFLKYLEYAYEKDGQNKELRKMLMEVSEKKSTDIVDSLNKLGYILSKKNIRDDFKKMGFKLLEQARTGKRDEVMYGITRIFLANNHSVPDILVEASKPYYPDNLFKLFIFVFLGSVIGEKEKLNEEV